MSYWNHENSQEVDHVIGAFYLIRKKLFDEVKGFDEGYFVYYEDIDLSHRVKEYGYTIYYLAEAKAYHKGGGTSEKIKAKRLFYSLRSKMTYSKKHLNLISHGCIVLVTFTLEPISRIFLSLLKGSKNELFEVLEAY